MGRSSSGWAGDNAAYPYTDLCICQDEGLASPKQFSSPARESCGSDQEKREGRPPKAIVRRDGDAEDENPRVRVERKMLSSWAQHLSKERASDQVPVADRIRRAP